jgi:pimeloyl-ACP methyl ester carboxylesterase
MSVWIIVAAILAAVGAYGMVLFGQWRASRRWLGHPLPPGKIVPLRAGSCYANVQGDGVPTVVVCVASGSLSLEWWSLQGEMTRETTVCTYDRGGIGWSQPSPMPRTSSRVVEELEELLQTLKLPPPYILIGHSIGGLFAQHFARQHPDWMAGLVLVDPLTLANGRFEALDATRYQASTAVKVSRMSRLRSFASRGLLRPMRVKLMASQQWESFRHLPATVQQALFEHFCLTKDYDASISELKHLEESIAQIGQVGPLPDIPVILLHHDPQAYQRELMAYGLSTEAAVTLESLWSGMHHELLAGVSQGQWVQVQRSSHSDIHLKEPELIRQAVQSILARKKASLS